MALTYSAFETFAEVASWYERTKPLGGADNLGKDIRPIGDRRRKWERIVKISDNCYALSDGFHFGDEHFPTWDRGTEWKATLKDMEKYAPIVWRKKRDGTETVTLRNGYGQGAHTGRYQFLWRHTPRGFTFVNRNGKHFIRTQFDGKEYYLAKVRTTPRPIYERIKQDAVNTTSQWAKARARWVQVQDDNSALTFKRTDAGWEFESGGKPIPVAPKKRVNVALKKALAPALNAFRDWAFAVTPMLPVRDYAYRNEMRNQMVEWAKEANVEVTGRWDLAHMFTPELARTVITDEEHPMRLHFAVAMRIHLNTHTFSEAETEAQLKAQFNRWANKELGLVKEVKE
jgi:hypothetical protein